LWLLRHQSVEAKRPASGTRWKNVAAVGRDQRSNFDDDFVVRGQRHGARWTTAGAPADEDAHWFAGRCSERRRAAPGQRLAPGPEDVGQLQSSSGAHEDDAGRFERDQGAVAAGASDPAGLPADRSAHADAGGQQDHPVGGKQLDMDSEPAP
jgi:hypothetical protein